MAVSMPAMIQVHAVPAFRDNYIWLLCGPDNGMARRPTAIVDPGDSRPVLQAIDHHHLTPVAILITHHHSDHVGGITDLCDRFSIPVYGPAQEAIPGLTHPLQEGSRIELPGLPTMEVLEVPGHTAGHIAYAGERLLFCGDTLFTGGCGRLFEGTAEQLYTSLQRLSSLPDDTWIYCAHEYTLGNLIFAQEVEPDNSMLQARIEKTRLLRLAGQSTVPATLEMERRTNPFLRCAIPTVVANTERHTGHSLAPGLETFAALRRWKDQWRG